jgi:IS5 family transposase
LEFLPELVGQLFGQHEASIIDSMPVPGCELARARRCRKLRGPHSRAFFGRCAAQQRAFFGWRLHLIVSATGIPVSFALLPASFHDLTPIHELTGVLPDGATLYGDAAYISRAVQRALRPTVRRPHGVRLVARHKRNMRPNTWAEREGLREHRPRVETVNAQLASMGVQRLHARTDAGLALKVLASLVEVACINLN